MNLNSIPRIRESHLAEAQEDFQATSYGRIKLLVGVAIYGSFNNVY